MSIPNFGLTGALPPAFPYSPAQEDDPMPQWSSDDGNSIVHDPSQEACLKPFHEDVPTSAKRSDCRKRMYNPLKKRSHEISRESSGLKRPSERSEAGEHFFLPKRLKTSHTPATETGASESLLEDPDPLRKLENTVINFSNYLADLPQILLRASFAAVPFLASDPYASTICQRYGFVFSADMSRESIDSAVSRLKSLITDGEAPDDLIYVWGAALLYCADPQGEHIGYFAELILSESRFRDILGMNGITIPDHFDTVVQCALKLVEIMQVYDTIYTLQGEASSQQLELKFFCDSILESELFQLFFMNLVEKFMDMSKINSL